MTVRRIALRAALLMALCGVLVPVLATGSASALTRGFSVYNLTGRTLRVDKIDVTGNTPVFEGLSLAQGDLVQPGEKVHVELFRGALGSENRTVTIKYAPIEANPLGKYFRIKLESNNGRSSCVVPSYSKSTDQCDAGSGSVKMLDPPGTTHDVPDTNRTAQAAIMANLCRSDSDASCEFVPAPKSAVNPDTHAHTNPVITSGIITNCSEGKDSEVTHKFSVDHITSSENSLEVGFEYEYDSNFLVSEAKVKISGSYGHKWTDELKYSDEIEAKIPSRHTGYVVLTAPVIRYTGDYKIKLANTEWTLHNVTWDVPDPARKNSDNYFVKERPATESENKICDQDDDSGTLQSSAHSLTITKRGNGGQNVLQGGPESNVLLGEGGNDLLVSGGGNNRLFGGAGNDVLLGNAKDGTNVLNGGPGADTIIDRGPAVVYTGTQTGRGWDYVYVRDGHADDTVVCQSRRTIVYADKGDRIRGRCGQVIRQGPINQPRPLM